MIVPPITWLPMSELTLRRQRLAAGSLALVGSEIVGSVITLTGARWYAVRGSQRSDPYRYERQARSAVETRWASKDDDGGDVVSNGD